MLAVLTDDLAAKAYAYGLALFPLQPGGRRPAAEEWQATASADPTVLAAWPADANIGVACRRSRLVVLDLDVKHDDNGIDTLGWHLARRREPWPQTLTVATPSGGRHVYFRARAGWTVPSSSGGRTRLGPGIDVRAPGRRFGGYVVGPGSTVDTGHYEISVDAPVQTLPAWMAGLIGRPDKG
ncbi:bifunctional DNA primase/polymerase [Streptomyces sp. NPDC096351]|uniref:bifunctional DNA primase/polymerase n=1 Tax=Streptomyces sp. NPDC096351 TaxID=3366087 RepID=UPI003808D67D